MAKAPLLVILGFELGRVWACVLFRLDPSRGIFQSAAGAPTWSSERGSDP